MLFVARCDPSKAIDLIEETFDVVDYLVGHIAKTGFPTTARH